MAFHSIKQKYNSNYDGTCDEKKLTFANCEVFKFVNSIAFSDPVGSVAMLEGATWFTTPNTHFLVSSVDCWGDGPKNGIMHTINFQL